MSQDDPHDLTGVPCHRVNTVICVVCQAHYCGSCDRGCPTCGFGEGLDRREAVRVPAEIEVRILPDGADEAVS